MYFDAVTDLLVLSDYEPPKLKDHIEASLKNIFNNSLSHIKSQNPLEYKITYQWPPKVGDEVYIMDGLYQGETGKVVCIYRGIGISSYGEAMVELDGLYHSDCDDIYNPMDKFPCRKYYRRTSRTTSSTVSSTASKSVSDDLGSSASQSGTPDVSSTNKKYVIHISIYKKNFT